MRWAIISEAYTSPLLIISKIKYSKTHFLICTAILSFSYIIHSLKNKKYTTLHYKVVYNYMKRKIKRNKSDFYEVNNAKRYFLLKKPKKSILELNLINPFTNYHLNLIILSHLNFHYLSFLNFLLNFLDLSHGHYLKKQVYGHWNIHKKLILSLSS